jgi:hypothetical protein
MTYYCNDMFETVSMWLSVATYKVGGSFPLSLFLHYCTVLALRLRLSLLALSDFTVSPYTLFLLSWTPCAAPKLTIILVSNAQLLNSTTFLSWSSHCGNCTFQAQSQNHCGGGGTWTYSERESCAYIPSPGLGHETLFILIFVNVTLNKYTEHSCSASMEAWHPFFFFASHDLFWKSWLGEA